MRISSLLIALLITVIAQSAFGATLNGRLGVTGKAGAMVPLKDDFISSTSESRTGLAFGGGLIFGFLRDFAVEVDVNHAPELDVEISGSKAYEASLTDVAVGLQYRILSDNRVVPFFGLGADFITGHLKHSASGADYNLDWTEGGHVNVGVDWFLTNSIAMSAEARYVFGFDGDVKKSGAKVGSYDPMNFIGTIGFRLILPPASTW